MGLIRKRGGFVFEIIIVILGVCFFALRFIWESIRDTMVSRSNSRLACMEAQLTNKKYEDEVTRFIEENLSTPDRIYDLIDDNMRAVYGDGYRNLPNLVAGKLTGHYKPRPEELVPTSMSCNGELGYIKCLVMSKKGYLPKAFYRCGATILYTNPHVSRKKIRAEMAYVAQIQKNLDLVKTGAQIIYVKTFKVGNNYDLHTKWQHDYLLPHIKDGILYPKY